jgi:hypothetical protein
MTLFLTVYSTYEASIGYITNNCGLRIEMKYNKELSQRRSVLSADLVPAVR